MSGIVRSRLRPPRGHPGRIDRPHLLAAIAEASSAPVLVVQADAGYGKTTAADMASRTSERIWYGLTQDDRDPLVFVAHLRVATDSQLQLDTAGESAASQTPTSWLQGLDHFISTFEARDASAEPVTLVLDDYHLVHRSPVDEVITRLLERIPPSLKLIITTREHLDLPGWIRARARGDIRDISRSSLAFAAHEILEYFQAGFGIELSDAQAQLLAEETEGWPIGLSLIAQHLRDRSSDPEALVAALPQGRVEIFDFLGDQVFRSQPARLRRFLLTVACLEVLDPASCVAVSDVSGDDIEVTLKEISRSGVFCDQGDAGIYRLHHLFRDFLEAQLTDKQRRDLHTRASRHFRSIGNHELAARHAIRAELVTVAASDVENAQPGLLAQGRHVTLLGLTEPLGIVLDQHPMLRIGRSEALRLTSRYADAIDEAQRARQLLHDDIAGEAAALAAEAKVYLDTVQPNSAATALEALGSLSDRLSPEASIELQVMVAENEVNTGNLRTAKDLLTAIEDDSSASQVAVIEQRLLVRTGRLQEVRGAIDAAEPAAHASIPDAHRENSAMTSWIYGLLGQGDRAEGAAREGIRVGVDLRSPIVSCVCWGRLGLGQLTLRPDDPEAARTSFLTSLRIAQEISVPRFRAEPLIGLTISAHRLGDFGDTMRFGLDAIRILDDAGDRYLGAMARLGVGVALADQNHPDASSWLREGRDAADECGDRYIPAIADQWLASLALDRDDAESFAVHARGALNGTSELSLDDIWASPSWLAIPDETRRRELLEAARTLEGVDRYASFLADRLGGVAAPTQPQRSAPASTAQPSLRISTLGAFAVTRDGEAVPASAWTRRKALELLWLLCADDHHSISRERAMDILWDGENSDAVSVRFRVALHALHLALEPDRPTRGETRFVRTSADRIWLDPDEVSVDIDDFRRLANEARQHGGGAGVASALEALELYQGGFVAEEAYLDSLRATRDALSATFRDLALETATTLIARSEFTKAAALGRQVLELDPYSESAFRTIATAYLAAGDGVAARRVFADCQRRLSDELGATPTWTLDSNRPNRQLDRKRPYPSV